MAKINETEILKEIKKLENEIKTHQNRGNYLYVANIIENIINAYIRININSKYKKEIESYKKQLLKTNNEAAKGFKKVSTVQKIKKNEIENFIKPFLIEKNFNNLIHKISDTFKIENKIVTETAKQSTPVSFMIVGIKSLDGKGNTKGISDNLNYRYIWNYQNYQSVNLNLMTILFNKLFETKIFTKKKLIEYFKVKSFFCFPSNLKKFLIGIDRYFSGDFLSSMSILSTTLENIIMTLSEHMGLDIIALNQKKNLFGTRDKILGSDLINTPEFIKIRGEDFSKQLDFVFFNQQGYKVRHKIAHGEMDYTEYNLMNANLILYFFIVLSVIVIENN